MTYNIRASRWAGGWELDIDGVGVTQSHALAGAERMVRDYLRLDNHRDWQTAELQWDYAIDEAKAMAELQSGRQKIAESERLAAEGAIAQRHAVRSLAKHYSASDIARIVGVSNQRVSQLLKS
jgi:hypothetical protein